jgi:hypothetical protein
MRPFCVLGKKISTFLIKTEKAVYPMEDTKYLETLPLYKDSYILMVQTKNNHYKLLKFLFVI